MGAAEAGTRSKAEAAVPVDLSVLASQTGADPMLEAEILRLWLAHAPADLDRLKRAATAAERRDVAHRMAGSAGAIGAGTVAARARAIEKGAAGAAAVAALAAAVDDAGRFLARHLAG